MSPNSRSPRPGKLYLSTIFDLYDRFPVAYAVSKRNDNKLVFDTYDKAPRDNPDAKPIFHSNSEMNSKVFTIRDIETLIKSIAEKYRVKEIYLFGSYAREDADESRPLCEPALFPFQCARH